LAPLATVTSGVAVMGVELVAVAGHVEVQALDRHQHRRLLLAVEATRVMS